MEISNMLKADLGKVTSTSASVAIDDGGLTNGLHANLLGYHDHDSVQLNPLGLAGDLASAAVNGDAPYPREYKSGMMNGVHGAPLYDYSPAANGSYAPAGNYDSAAAPRVA